MIHPVSDEDVGWIVEQTGRSGAPSDYPHVEGGRRPIERFERSLENCSDEFASGLSRQH